MPAIRASLKLLLPLLALTLACSSSSPTGPANSNSVSIVDFSFTPAARTVATGTTVTWKNNGGTSHTTTSNAAGWDSGTLAPGASFTHTFTTAGTFAYRCTIHPNMTGTITVQ